MSGKPLLFFDGECGLCHRLVRWLLSIDRRRELQFAPLQGRSAQKYFRAHGLPAADFDTLIFSPDGPEGTAAPLVRTTGLVAALRAVGRPGLAGTVAAIPRPLRDAAYRFVGHVRYRMFGPWKPRPLPRPEWAARFVD